MCVMSSLFQCGIWICSDYTRWADNYDAFVFCCCLFYTGWHSSQDVQFKTKYEKDIQLATLATLISVTFNNINDLYFLKVLIKIDHFDGRTAFMSSLAIVPLAIRW